MPVQICWHSVLRLQSAHDGFHRNAGARKDAGNLRTDHCSSTRRLAEPCAAPNRHLRLVICLGVSLSYVSSWRLVSLVVQRIRRCVTSQVERMRWRTVFVLFEAVKVWQERHHLLSPALVVAILTPSGNDYSSAS